MARTRKASTLGRHRATARNLHRFAPKLTVWQIRNACAALAGTAELTTDRFIAWLTEHDIVSNVEIDEVQPVRWSDLKGMDEVVAALATKIARGKFFLIDGTVVAQTSDGAENLRRGSAQGAFGNLH